ncbi:MAG: metallophosphoesterase family protein [Acidobacteriota bacterium]
MRIGFLGDIHGNIVALERCYGILKDEGCENIYHLGDLVGYGPFPNECVEFIRLVQMEGVRGNYDENAAYKSEDCGCDFGDDTEFDLYHRTYLWTRDRVSHAARSLLIDLPFDINFKAGKQTYSLFHANPFDIYTSIWESRGDDFMRDMARYTGADVNVFAHTHVPFHKNIDGIHFINVGSVGNPKDGNPRASCVILDADANVRVRILRVEYDIEKVAEAIRKSPLPSEIADRLLIGK